MKDIKDITKSYPKLFNGLVLFLSLYQIRVKENANHTLYLRQEGLPFDYC